MNEPMSIRLDDLFSPSPSRSADDPDADDPAPGDAPDSTVRARLHRLLELIDVLRSRERTVHELAEWFDVSPRAVRRDLRDLAEMYVGLEEVAPHTYRIPTSVQPLDPVQALAAHAAVRLLYHHAPARDRHALAALDKLAQNLPEPARTAARRSTRERRERLPADRTFELVARAWFERRVLAFDYVRPGGSGRTYRHELEVYFVEVSRDTFAPHVIGRDRARGGPPRTFKLSRMQRPALLPDRYDVPEDFDPREHLSNAWGVIGGDARTVTVHLRFAYAAASRLLEGGYPTLDVTTIHQDHSVDVQVRAGVDEDGRPRELLFWVLGWGAQVEVLDPPEVRDAWRRELRAAFARHGGPDDAPWTPPTDPWDEER